MKTAYFFPLTLILIFLIHLVLDRYVVVGGGSPYILMLAIVALGIKGGAFVGETLGFWGGLLADSMGAQLFGLHALILSIIGYAAGKCQRKIEAGEIFPQAIIGALTTILFSVLVNVTVRILGEVGPRIQFVQLLGMIIINVIFAPLVFWGVERWLRLWGKEIGEG